MGAQFSTSQSKMTEIPQFLLAYEFPHKMYTRRPQFKVQAFIKDHMQDLGVETRPQWVTANRTDTRVEALQCWNNAFRFTKKYPEYEYVFGYQLIEEAKKCWQLVFHCAPVIDGIVYEITPYDFTNRKKGHWFFPDYRIDPRGGLMVLTGKNEYSRREYAIFEKEGLPKCYTRTVVPCLCYKRCVKRDPSTHVCVRTYEQFVNEANNYF